MKKLLFLAALMFSGLAMQQVTAQANAAATPAKEQSCKLKITGMTCGGCANRVSTALGKVDGVLSEEVQYPGDVAVVKYDPTRTNEKSLVTAVESSGFKASVLKDEEPIPHGQKGHVCSPECGKPAKGDN
ncbi:MAG: heavy-metal-associated domain-containing protein [Bacteroidota bacterium]